MVKLKKHLCFICLAFTVFLFGVGVVCAQESIAVLKEHSGAFVVKSQGRWKVNIPENMPLYHNDKILTQEGKVFVVFNDGAVLNVYKNSNIRIEERVASSGIKNEGSGVERGVHLDMGKAYFKTNSSLAHTRIVTPTGVCALRGTELIASIDIIVKGEKDGMILFDQENYLRFSEGGAETLLGLFIPGEANNEYTNIANKHPIQSAGYIAAANMVLVQQGQAQLENGEVDLAEFEQIQNRAKNAIAFEMIRTALFYQGNPDEVEIQEGMEFIELADEILEQTMIDTQAAMARGGRKLNQISPGKAVEILFGMPQLSGNNVEDPRSYGFTGNEISYIENVLGKAVVWANNFKMSESAEQFVAYGMSQSASTDETPGEQDGQESEEGKNEESKKTTKKEQLINDLIEEPPIETSEPASPI